MILIVSKYLIPKRFKAIALFPFILIRDNFETNNLVLINHEKIHLRQQLELLIIPFYALYFIDFILKIILFKDKNKAYKNILFEREAYLNEENLDYLQTRPFWNWTRYLKG
jgi:hypothetical protein